MKIITTDQEAIWDSSTTRRDMYERIAAAGIGQTIELEAGEDYPDDGNPNRYRQRIISAMRHRNLAIESRIRDKRIYVRVLGPIGKEE